MTCIPKTLSRERQARASTLIIRHLMKTSERLFRLDVLSAPNDGLNPCFILTVKKVIESQYLFNVPEGFARFVLEHKLRPGLGLRAVFLTGVGHECHGLPGLVMRLRGDGHGAFELFGPLPSVDYVKALPNVCSWKNPAILVNQNSTKDVYEDENVIIRGIVQGHDVDPDIDFLHNSSYDRATILEQLGRLCPSSHTHEHTIFGRKYTKEASVQHGNVWLRNSTQEESQTAGSCRDSIVLGYMCHIKTSGETILLSGYLDESLSQAEAMMKHPAISTCMGRTLFIMCSSFQKPTANVYDDRLGTFIHLNVVGDASEGSSNLGFDSTARVSSRLHGVCPYLFPLPHCWKYLKHSSTSNELQDTKTRTSGVSGPFNGAFQLHACGAEWTIEPYISETCIQSIEDLLANQKKSEAIDTIESLKILQDRVRQRIERNPSKDIPEGSNMSAAAVLRQSLLSSKKRKLASSPVEDDTQQNNTKVDMHSMHGPYVLFLGTGSAEPSKYRGPSGIFVKIPYSNKDEYILLECGEGTFGQLVRMFGYSGAMERIANTRCIWISHRHADHMSGLVELVSRRAICKSPQKLLVLGPKACIKWISSLRNVIDVGNIDVEHITAIHSSPACKRLQHAISASVRCTPVHHCHDAYAISICFQNTSEKLEKFKLVYSGDTEPCQALIDLGQGADLLIHEATFDPDMIQDARKKKHSTITEAIDIATRMSAKRTVLTHFSQRYPKFPKGVPDNHPGIHPLGVAFDGYCLPWTLLDEYHTFMPYFRDALEHNPA